MAMDALCPLVSVVVPVYAGRRTLPDLVHRCAAMRDGVADAPASLLHELIFVCDEPIDDSELLLIDTARQY